MTDRIKIECKKNGISIPILADKIKMTKTGLYLALKNKTLSLDKLQKVAEILKLPSTFFFDNYLTPEKSEILKQKEEEITKLTEELLIKNKLINSYEIILKQNKIKV